MSIFTSISKRYKAITAKQFMLGGVFAIALAAAIIGGFSAKQLSSATASRDCTTNSIDFQPINGGCGAASPTELIQDIQANNPSDLQTIYADPSIGLTSDKYQRFAATAQPGQVLNTGDVIVDGQTVMTGAWSMGRKSFGNPNRIPIVIGGVTYFNSPTSTSFAAGVTSIPVMVMFDQNGTAEVAIMNPCGNPVLKTNKVVSTFECRELQKHAVAGKDDTYTFTTNAPVTNFAKVVKVEYFVDSGNGPVLFDTQSNPTDNSKAITLTKTSTVSVKVTFSLPGKQTRVITSTNCAMQIEVKPKVVMHVCSNLIATSTDNQTFRFTMTTAQDQGVTVKSADFTLDGTSTTTGVATKDTDGNIFREFTFTDEVQHTVHIKRVTFVVDGQDVVVTVPDSDCATSVTPKQTPPCTKNPNLPECKTCVPTATQDVNCHELPHTGPAGTAGLFAGVSALGAAGHRLVMKRRARRSQ